MLVLDYRSSPDTSFTGGVQKARRSNWVS